MDHREDAARPTPSSLWREPPALRRDAPARFAKRRLILIGAVAIRRSVGGHYLLDAEVDGQPVRFMIDTGASTVVFDPRGCRAPWLHRRPFALHPVSRDRQRPHPGRSGALARNSHRSDRFRRGSGLGERRRIDRFSAWYAAARAAWRRGDHKRRSDTSAMTGGNDRAWIIAVTGSSRSNALIRSAAGAGRWWARSDRVGAGGRRCQAESSNCGA
ncbi:MAG: hypothetical protein GC191_14400 [Azospirillum sp.]|nr:hypothetical protein [Azospirillum sp.]